MHEANKGGKNVISASINSKLDKRKKKTGITIRIAYDGDWSNNARNFEKVLLKICRKHHFIIETCFDC